MEISRSIMEGLVAPKSFSMATKAKNCSYFEILTNYQEKLASVEELSLTCQCNSTDLFNESVEKKQKVEEG